MNSIFFSISRLNFLKRQYAYSKQNERARGPSPKIPAAMPSARHKVVIKISKQRG